MFSFFWLRKQLLSVAMDQKTVLQRKPATELKASNRKLWLPNFQKVSFVFILSLGCLHLVWFCWETCWCVLLNMLVHREDTPVGNTKLNWSSCRVSSDCKDTRRRHCPSPQLSSLLCFSREAMPPEGRVWLQAPMANSLPWWPWGIPPQTSDLLKPSQSILDLILSSIVFVRSPGKYLG